MTAAAAAIVPIHRQHFGQQNTLDSKTLFGKGSSGCRKLLCEKHAW
eukprot:CAMPEP_0119329778 /NCGR_PEP_ID=MMETSP1333-20130426/76674_1 /TAXON_ID=418940 /ORGANISM="Scyphosphaera apsteinii, Strain RCC1455" /LENGTH=45 /DNA_ID= /DNA_START= /DNA_END= /DNA_ORIENTATION=